MKKRKYGCTSSHIIKILSTISVSLCLAFVSQTWAKDSIEISSSNDFEAPEIAHDVEKDVGRNKEGDVVIKAQVTDEFSVNSVSVYFRDSGNSKYRKRSMILDSKSGKDIYKAEIPKTALGGKRIEYYFEADDKVGNKKLKGLEFSPLKRAITDLVLVNGNSVEIADTETKPEPEKPQKVVIKEPPAKKATPKRDIPPTSLDAPMVWMPGL